MMDKQTYLPEQKRSLLELMVAQLSRISGVSAIVLGGSYASGSQHKASDIDLGLYYYPAQPFSIADIRRIAEDVAVDGKVKVTGFYEWGAWVNGGAWIHTRQGKVDFLYRNVQQVERTIAEAQQGIAHHDYAQQPSYGFYSVIYLAETEVCVPLYDPDSVIAQLKRQVAIYPARLKEKIMADSLWSADFTLLHARNFAAQGDVYNTVGCLARVAANLTQVLFALNERYFMRHKQVMEVIATFPICPDNYVEQINHILGKPGRSPSELQKTVGELEKIWHRVLALPGIHYRPQYEL